MHAFLGYMRCSTQRCGQLLKVSRQQQHSQCHGMFLRRYLLPPVIFYAGLSVEKSRFFIALPSILMYGVFGTLASFIIISVFMYLTLGFALFKMEVRQGAVLGPGQLWP